MSGEYRGRAFDGIHNLTQSESLVFSACHQKPVNGLKAVGPKLIVKEPVRNKPMSQKSEKKTCFEVVPVNIIELILGSPCGQERRF